VSGWAVLNSGADVDVGDASLALAFVSWATSNGSGADEFLVVVANEIADWAFDGGAYASFFGASAYFAVSFPGFSDQVFVAGDVAWSADWAA